MTRHSYRKILFRSVFCCLLASAGAQHSFGQFSQILLSGRVVAAEGADAGPARVELACPGMGRQELYTDPAGYFQFRIDPSQELGRGGAGPGKQAPAWKETWPLGSCELQAYVPGFESPVIHLDLADARGMIQAGPIVLRRLSRRPPMTIGASSLLAPKKARKSWEKGRRALQAGNLEEAQAALAAAITIYPQYAVAWADLGLVHFKRNDMEQARTAYLQALAADSGFVPACLGLAVVGMHEGNWEQVADRAEQAIRLQPLGLPQAHYLQALANLQLGRLQAAERSAEEAARQDAGRQFPEIDYVRGLVEARRQNYPAAARYLRRYLDRAPRTAPLAVVTRQLAGIEKLRNGGIEE